jgi:predicted RNase H-like HicB family nuclease
MQVRVKFSQYDGYWVAEAENGAVSQGKTLEECRENILDAVKELATHDDTGTTLLSERVEVLEVAL